MPDLIINHIYQVRVALGMTQKDLASKVGVSVQTITSIENGNFLPSIKLALRIANTLDKPMEQVFEIQRDKD